MAPEKQEKKPISEKRKAYKAEWIRKKRRELGAMTREEMRKLVNIYKKYREDKLKDLEMKQRVKELKKEYKKENPQ